MNTVRLLMEDGISEKKALKLVATKNAWVLRKHVLERPLARVPEWRCPVHGCLLEISYCVECRIDSKRKLDRLNTIGRMP